MGLVKLLTDHGFTVQLKHVEAESEETRDRVWLKNEKGEELATSADMQHNRNYYKMEENAQSLFETAKTKMAEATAEAVAETTGTTEATIFTKAAEAAATVGDATAPAEAVNA
jgi:hypothetical protein